MAEVSIIMQINLLLRIGVDGGGRILLKETSKSADTRGMKILAAIVFIWTNGGGP